jgi:hypothetical protein
MQNAVAQFRADGDVVLGGDDLLLLGDKHRMTSAVLIPLDGILAAELQRTVIQSIVDRYVLPIVEAFTAGQKRDLNGSPSGGGIIPHEAEGEILKILTARSVSLAEGILIYKAKVTAQAAMNLTEELGKAQKEKNIELQNELMTQLSTLMQVRNFFSKELNRIIL